MKKILVCSLLSISTLAMAQEVEQTPLEKTQAEVERISTAIDHLSKLKVSGYFQTDWQFGQEKSSLKVGSPKAESENSFSRFGIRRGRIKFAYSDFNLFGVTTGSAVMQLDATEKGVGIKDLYFTVADPWTGWFTLTSGLFNRPFGYEIAYSSSARETPERSTGILTLFPEERDLGSMLTIQAPKGHALNGLKLETGLFAGNGIKSETDNQKDWMSHLTYKKTHDNVQWGLGASFYLGGVYQGSTNVYEMLGKSFVAVNNQKVGGYSTRRYYGLDGQLLISSVLGMTQLRAEMVTGVQPGALNDSKSPNSSSLPTIDTYRRNFFTYNIYFIQDIAQTKHSIALRYDSYDPNTKVSLNEIGVNGTGKGDIAKHNIGISYLYRMNKNFRLMANYDIAYNEKSNNLKGFESDLNDNTFTLRLQYKF